MSDRQENQTHHCNGCDEPYYPDQLEEMKMVYGGSEELCKDCIEDSWEMIA